MKIDLIMGQSIAGQIEFVLKPSLSTDGREDFDVMALHQWARIAGLEPDQVEKEVRKARASEAKAKAKGNAEKIRARLAAIQSLTKRTQARTTAPDRASEPNQPGSEDKPAKTLPSPTTGPHRRGHGKAP